MTKITLDGNKRQILRARVRRHPAAANLGDVSTLSNPDLVQWALAHGIGIPSDAADAAYKAAKAAGKSAKAAQHDADAADGLTSATAPTPTAGGEDNGARSEDANEADADAAQDQPEDAADADAAQDQPEDADAAKAVEEAVKAILAPMGAGDLATFQARLRDTVKAALEPKTIAAPTGYFDPAKVQGRVPQVVAHKTMREVGINALPTALEEKTRLPVMDAEDAPPVDPSYVWPDDTALAIAALAQGRNLFLWGPAGTGKTTWAQQLAARYGRPFERISCDDQTEAATLVGMTVPDGNGGVKWQDGQLSRAIRRAGTVILIDEPSVARAGALMVLQALLDNSRALRAQETGELIPVAPHVVFVAADNTNGTGDETGQYEGTRRLNRAFLDRFDFSVAVDYLPVDREAQVLAKTTGIKPAHALALAKFAAATRAGATEGKVSHGVGLRTLAALARGIVSGGDPARVFQLAAIAKAPFEDREPLRQLWESHIAAGAFK